MESTVLSLDTLREVIDLAGGQAALAKRLDEIGQRQVPALRCKPQNVWAWLNRDHRVPGEWVRHLAEAVEYRVTPHRIRPDLYPHPDDGLPEHMRMFGALEEFSEVLTTDERGQLDAAIASRRPQEVIRLIECLDVQIHVRAKLLEAAQRFVATNGEARQ